MEKPSGTFLGETYDRDSPRDRDCPLGKKKRFDL